MRLFLSLLLLLVTSAAQAADVGNMRTWAAPDSTRVVFDISGPVKYRLFQMPDPHRIVLDMHNTRLAKPLYPTPGQDRLVARVRAAHRGAGQLRMVFDVQDAVKIKSFLLPPNRQYGHRLVLDFFKDEWIPPSTKLTQEQPRGASARDIVVAIDAGHGGEDSGAEGVGGTREKDVVLAIARKLATLVNEERGMRAVMIRDGDYYVGLRERMKQAREQKADLFVSIHADAFSDPRASGSSVYVLSQRGVSSEAARWLAERENAADLVGGVSLDDKDDIVKAVLLDLSQTAVINASAKIAGRVLGSLTRLGRVHQPHVQRAGFMVLKSPDVPSILVETAFITNPGEERRLTDPTHQRALAAAIMEGVRAYFRDSAPAGTLLAMRKEFIEPADMIPRVSTN
jgi:N-acetylmuramoyl-L-alanine amidase